MHKIGKIQSIMLSNECDSEVAQNLLQTVCSQRSPFVAELTRCQVVGQVHLVGPGWIIHYYIDILCTDGSPYQDQS